jgi:beta-xylosidase
MVSDASFDGPYLPLNILLRDAPAGDFEISTALHFTPTSDYQAAGLVVFQEQGNALQLSRAFCDVVNACVGDGVYFDNFENGSSTGSNYHTAFHGSVIYLRLRREGNTYTGYYSEDGQNWIMTGKHVRDFSQIRVGLVAAQASTEIPAVFDYFTMDALQP